MKILSKFSRTAFSFFWEFISSKGLSCDSYWEGVVKEKFTIVKAFWGYFSKFLLILHEIFFGSNILWQTLKVSAQITSLEVPILAAFSRFVNSLSCLFWNNYLAHDNDLFTNNWFNVPTFTCSKIFFRTLCYELIINTMQTRLQQNLHSGEVPL